MDEWEAIVWVFGIFIAGCVITSVVKAIAEAAVKIKGYDNDPQIFNRTKEPRDDAENGTDGR